MCIPKSIALGMRNLETDPLCVEPSPCTCFEQRINGCIGGWLPEKSGAEGVGDVESLLASDTIASMIEAVVSVICFTIESRF